MQLQSQLTTLLFGDTTVAQAVAHQLSQNSLWSNILKLSFDWRITPQLWQRIQSLNIDLSEKDRKELASLCRIISCNSNLAAHRSVQILNHLEKSSVAAIAFKGIGVMAALYPKPSDRMVSDVDILIDSDSLRSTYDALIEIGFNPVVSEDLVSNYFEYLEHRTRKDNMFLIFKDASGFEIDLHWGLKATNGMSFNVANLIQNATTGQLLNQTVAVANPVDAMVLTVHHAVRDDFAPATTVKDLCDLNAWWTVAQSWSIDDVAKRARESGLILPLYALWTVLANYNATSPAVAGLEQLQNYLTVSEQDKATRLSELFHWQLQGEKVNRDLLHGLSMSTLKRFFLRRLQKKDTIAFDQSLWGIQTNQKQRWQKLHQLLKTVLDLDKNKLDAYRALSELQNVE